jgi:transcriptional regulator with XRE-family HTH domain
MDEKKLKTIFAANLKRLRTERGLSQLSFAGKADLAPNFINDLEQERKSVSFESLAKIADAFRVSPHELFLPVEKLPPEREEALSRYTEELVKETVKAIRTVHKRFQKGK